MHTQHDPVLLWPEGAPASRGDSPEDNPRLTPLLHDDGMTRPCIIVFPGGGYQMRADHERFPIAEWLCSLGLNAFVLDYRVAPYRHPVPLGDAKRAIRLVRHHAKRWHVDPSRTGVLGFSAGGHLAASAATLFDDGDAASPDAVDRLSSRPDIAVLCYPVISFQAFGPSGSGTNLLGTAPDNETVSGLSLETRVTDRTPPTFLWHTADDQAVPVGNALLFARSLGEHGVPFSLHVFPHGQHGLGLAAGNPTVGAWRDLCARWLVDQGFRMDSPEQA
jgi:acetyl esterase/lipase